MTHVRYTPHSTLHERPGDTADSRTFSPDHAPQTSFEHMLRDIVRYVPGLARSEYTGSMWEIKTVLPQSEHDDSRPILLHRSPGTGRFWTVLGAKIDGAYDVLDSLKELPGFATSSAR